MDKEQARLNVLPTDFQDILTADPLTSPKISNDEIFDLVSELLVQSPKLNLISNTASSPTDQPFNIDNESSLELPPEEFLSPTEFISFFDTAHPIPDFSDEFKRADGCQLETHDQPLQLLEEAQNATIPIQEAEITGTAFNRRQSMLGESAVLSCAERPPVDSVQHPHIKTPVASSILPLSDGLFIPPYRVHQPMTRMVAPSPAQLGEEQTAGPLELTQSPANQIAIPVNPTPVIQNQRRKSDMIIEKTADEIMTQIDLSRIPSSSSGISGATNYSPSNSNNGNFPNAGTPKLRYSEGAAPSNYCHICGRASSTAKLAPCANIKLGLCRKTLCEKCLLLHQRNFFSWAKAKNSTWTCTHCRSVCPPRARCHQYQRNNMRRRSRGQNEVGDTLKETPPITPKRASTKERGVSKKLSTSRKTKKQGKSDTSGSSTEPKRRTKAVPPKGNKSYLKSHPYSAAHFEDSRKKRQLQAVFGDCIKTAAPSSAAQFVDKADNFSSLTPIFFQESQDIWNQSSARSSAGYNKSSGK